MFSGLRQEESWQNAKKNPPSGSTHYTRVSRVINEIEPGSPEFDLKYNLGDPRLLYELRHSEIFRSIKREVPLSADFSDGENSFTVSNIRFGSLIDFAIAVGTDLAATEQERASVARLSHSREKEFWPGHGLKLNEYFTDLDDRKFWAIVFHAIACLVFRREIGNQDDDSWQVGVISECRMVSLMLTHLVWTEDRGWYPEDSLEFGAVPDSIRLQNKA